MEDGGHEPGFLTPQRSEALSDGIFAVAIGAFLSSPALANLVFVLMAVITPLSRRIEKRELRRSPPAEPVAAR